MNCQGRVPKAGGNADYPPRCPDDKLSRQMEGVLRNFDLGGVSLLYGSARGDMSDDELVAWLERYRQALQSARDAGRRTATIVDLRHSEAPTAKQRRLQTDWNRETESLVRVVTLCIAFVVSSRVMRGIMTAIFWVKPPAARYALFESMHDALTWTLESCKRSGVSIDPESERASWLALSR